MGGRPAALAPAPASKGMRSTAACLLMACPHGRCPARGCPLELRSGPPALTHPRTAAPALAVWRLLGLCADERADRPGHAQLAQDGGWGPGAGPALGGPARHGALACMPCAHLATRRACSPPLALQSPASLGGCGQTCSSARPALHPETWAPLEAPLLPYFPRTRSCTRCAASPSTSATGWTGRSSACWRCRSARSPSLCPSWR